MSMTNQTFGGLMGGLVGGGRAQASGLGEEGLARKDLFRNFPMSANPPPPPVLHSFHRRELPCPPAISFGSPEGRSIFLNALSTGGGESYFDLISHFVTQGKPAFCGLSTLVVVLNALNIDPRRSWRGSPWRYFDEEVREQRGVELVAERVARGLSLPPPF